MLRGEILFRSRSLVRFRLFFRSSSFVRDVVNKFDKKVLFGEKDLEFR